MLFLFLLRNKGPVEELNSENGISECTIFAIRLFGLYTFLYKSKLYENSETEIGKKIKTD